MAERPRELGDFKKARVNGGTNNHSLKDSHKCLRCRSAAQMLSNGEEGDVMCCVRDCIKCIQMPFATVSVYCLL